ncbi:PAS domain S-box protein [Anoxynatronum buryatiense]|uniref:PAS domain S-box-containing protein/diguanylate cyclase (GGDEF) domain-containing protein n=1 Tax=Anoxynatronum buryatiense TaxID=489973 RepID=A0AA45WYB0_9CLOT|nr:PAS domain S-box-containing protein/diguanylate cyclase (GGDEF) domain-containing protein [Anoxynatronum buryatiense]
MEQDKLNDNISTSTSIGTAVIQPNVFLEGTHDAVVLLAVTPGGDFFYQAANRRYLEVTGLSLEELLGKTPGEVHGEKTGRHIIKNLINCVDACQPIQYEETLMLAGQLRSALVQLSPVMDETGEVRQILGSTRDITDQKRIEQQLKEQNKNLEALFTNSSDGIVFFDRDHRIVNINQRFQEIFGYSPEDVRGKCVDDLITRSHNHQEAEELTSRLMSGELVNTQAVRYHRDGFPLTVDIRGLVVKVEGEITGGYGIYTDITREKQVQEALALSEERWQFALEGSDQGVWDWNMESGEVFYSSQYLRILGYQPGDLEGSYATFQRLVHPEDWEKLISDHEQHVAGEIPVVAMEYRMHCQDGRWKWVLSKGKVMQRDQNGTPLRMTGTINDITERKLAEEKIRFLSYHDKLTGLYNRAFFEEEMYRMDTPRNWPLTIIIGDVDGLKMANDFHGHHVGDRLLTRIAEILTSACRADDVIARWGGDEFAILLPGTGEEGGRKIGERITRLCSLYEDLPVKPSLSWGSATKDSASPSLEALIRKAELEMYKKKVNSSQSTRQQLRKRYAVPDLDKAFQHIIKQGGINMIRELVEKNRTYRRFDETREISEEQLREWVDLARITSSGANLQPLKYHLSWQSEKNERIFPHLRWAGYLKDWEGPVSGERPTAYIVVLGDTLVSKNYWWDHGLASQSILLAAVEEGFGGCMFGSIDRDGLREALNLDPRFEILLVIALGKPVEKVILEPLKPDGDIKYYRDDNQVHHVPKRSLEEVIVP